MTRCNFGMFFVLAVGVVTGCGGGDDDGTAATSDAAPGVNIDAAAGSDAAVVVEPAALSAHRAAAGDSVSVAIDDDGAIWTWGNDSMLGDGVGRLFGLSNHSYVPTRPTIIDGFTMTDVEAGFGHVLALQDNGDIWAWGGNSLGELGNDDMGNNALEPVQVSLADAAMDVGAGATHSLAITVDGALYAWGSNAGNQLGDGTNILSAVPVAVDISALPAGTKFLAVDGGNSHSIALAEDGSVWTWGAGAPQLGLGGADSALTPTQVVGEGGTGLLTGIIAIDAGFVHNLALAEDGKVYAWGSNFGGQLGTGDKTQSNTPLAVDLSGLTSAVVAVRTNRDQSYALLADQSLLGWGKNQLSELGLSPTTDALVPTPIDIPGGVIDVSAGREHGIAVDSTGAFWGWGQNAGGQIGNGDFADALTPQQTYGPSGLVASGVFRSKGSYTHIAMSDGSIWGLSGGTAVSGSTGSTPTPILSSQLVGLDVAQISGGIGHSLILDTSGVVWGIGANSNGQLGNNTTTQFEIAPVEVDISMLPNGVTVTKVGVTSAASALLASDGSVWTWGFARFGALGTGDDTSSTSAPAQVRDAAGTGFLANIDDIALGNDHMVALDGNGTAWTWGHGGFGQLGASLDTICAANSCNVLPHAVCDIDSDVANCTLQGTLLGAVQAIATGDSFTLLLRGGGVVSFGRGNFGQLGNSTNVNSLTPAVVRNSDNSGVLTGIERIAASDRSSYALATDGTFHAWGENRHGQLGIDPTAGGSICTGQSCRRRPQPIAQLSTLTIDDFQVGVSMVIVLDSTGQVWTWGRGFEGSLGRPAEFSTGGVPYDFVPRLVRLLPQ